MNRTKETLSEFITSTKTEISWPGTSAITRRPMPGPARSDRDHSFCRVACAEIKSLFSVVSVSPLVNSAQIAIAWTLVAVYHVDGRLGTNMHRGKILLLVALIAPGLAACATQQAMTVADSAVVASNPKYRNAVAVRSVTGGRLMNAATVMGVEDEPFKAALENSLAVNGYLAKSGTPRFYVDAEIVNLDQPFIGLDFDVTAEVTYKVSGASAPSSYPIKTTARATFSDSPIGADRMRIANERVMQQNIKQFLLALR
jgi:hypothetical protein